MDRYRLIATIVVLFVYLLAMYPWQTIGVSIFLVAGYLIIRNLSLSNQAMSGEVSRRRAALNDAKIYLSPYSDIWRNLRLSNKYCELRLGADGQSIRAKDLKGSRYFKVTRSRVHSRNDLWDMFCVSFSHNTTFDELVRLSEIFETDIDLKGERKNVKEVENIRSTAIKVDTTEPKKSKLDVNNASEVELTALPGISIVMAKKLIKKREELGGFKSVNDVFLFLHIKPHIQLQLENLICVNKMKSSGKIKRYNERSIDL